MKQELTNIKVPKETAQLVRIYCIFNNVGITEFATNILEKELEFFKRKLEEMRTLS